MIYISIYRKEIEMFKIRTLGYFDEESVEVKGR